jgi:Ca-activated chloride channel homolog
MRNMSWMLVLVLSLVAMGAATACVVIPLPPPRPEIQPLRLEVRSQHVQTTVTDQVARTTVTTTLYNPHDRPVEGTFLFPLPPEAAVSDFSYWIGDKEMKGELLDRDKARKIYEDIVRQLRDPALLEYDGAGVFKASIFPIPAKGEAKTRLQFTQVLHSENGVVRFVHAVKLGRSNPNHGKLVIDVNIRSQVPIKAVYSPTHQVEVVRKGDQSVSVGMELDNTDYNRDFELYYTLADKDFGLNILTHRGEGEAGYFMMLLSPKQDWGEREIENKDVVFCLDTSGSMRGEKLDQARKAFIFCLKALRPGDRFGLITYATETRHFEEKLLEASPDNVKRAVEFVSKLEGTGSTALNDALVESAALLGKASSRPSMILFLTDGLPTQGETEPKNIITNFAKANHTGAGSEPGGRRARLFTFGVGDDVNTHLLDQLAEGNGGSTNYVRPSEDIEASVSALYSKLSHPVLSNVKVSLGGAKPHEVYPQRLPDLFMGSQLVVSGRYDATGSFPVVLTGQAGGKEKTYTYEATFPKEAPENAFVARVWAVRRVGMLLDEIRLHGENAELKEEVVRLAVKFGIVTPYTSYLVQEDEKLGRRLDAFSGVGNTPGAPAPKAALQATTGAGAINAAQSIGQMKQDDRGGTSGDQTYRVVGQRTFYLGGEWWTESTWSKDLRILKIQAYSPAYFDLLKARPDLAACLALGDQVRVCLGTLGLEVGPEGETALTPQMLEEIRK